jgi:LPXTG-motif cell wall-anchored protein
MQLALFPAPATFEQLSLELFTNQPTTERPNTTMHTTTSPTHRRRSAQALVIVLAAIAAVVFTLGHALAHHPELTGSTTCRTAGEPWTATWTAHADQTRGLTWQIAGYTPAGPQADNIALQRSASYPEGQTSATETATASWSNGATGTRSATREAPAALPDAEHHHGALDDHHRPGGDHSTTTTAPPATTTPAETTTTSSTVLVAVTDPPVPTTSIVQPPRFPAPTALPETGPSSITPWALLLGAAAIAAGLLTLRRARR